MKIIWRDKKNQLFKIDCNNWLIWHVTQIKKKQRIQIKSDGKYRHAYRWYIYM